MATLQWGYVFIWIGVGFISLLSGIIISSIRRSWRRAQLSHIPNKSMSVFHARVLGRRLSRYVEDELATSMKTRLLSAPTPPTGAQWGWSPVGSDLGDVNYQQVILNSPRLIEYGAKTHSWIRHPSQSMEDFLAMISANLPTISEATIDAYLKKYNDVRFNGATVSNKQYERWLHHFVSILRSIDKSGDIHQEIRGIDDLPYLNAPIPRKKRTKKAKIDA